MTHFTFSFCHKSLEFFLFRANFAVLLLPQIAKALLPKVINTKIKIVYLDRLPNGNFFRVEIKNQISVTIENSGPFMKLWCCLPYEGNTFNVRKSFIKRSARDLLSLTVVCIIDGNEDARLLLWGPGLLLPQDDWNLDVADGNGFILVKIVISRSNTVKA